MAVAGKKVLMVIPERDFRDEEYDLPRRILEGRGAKVTVASERLSEARGMRGMAVRPDVKLEDVKYYDYDAIVFVGGEGARQYFEHEKATKLARDADRKVLGAIGNAPIILANAGIVKGKRITGDRAMAGLLNAKGGIYTGQPVEVDEKVVTADGPAYAEQFGNALTMVLEKS